MRSLLNAASRLFDRVVPRKLTGTLSVEPMWFLAEPEDTEAFAALPPVVSKALKDIRTDGVGVLPRNVPHETCDALIADFEAFCKRHRESEQYRDEFSLHERLACLHLESEAARNVTFDPTVSAILEAAFRAPYVVVGSLFFEKGSTQSVHRDTPAFFTNPLNHFFGVWNAMEDVKEGNGPLVYYRGGHKIAPDEELYRNPNVKSENYFRIVEEACRKADLEFVEFYPKKGDTLIWHPQLPHGGAPIANPRISRRSLVCHYIPRNVPIHGADVFFGSEKRVATKRNYHKVRFGQHEAIDLVRPQFYHNRYEGNFDE